MKTSEIYSPTSTRNQGLFEDSGLENFFMSSSRSNTDSEHLQNFESLPFSLCIDNHFTYPNFQSAYLQISTSSISHPNLYQHRVTGISSPPTPSSSDITDTTYSSLPPLVPNSDISDTVHQQFIEIFSRLSLSDPPNYTPSNEDPPVYEPSDSDTIVRRRIQALEIESEEIVQQIRDLRTVTIAQISADIENQIEEHRTRYRNIISDLERLLEH